MKVLAIILSLLLWMGSLSAQEYSVSTEPKSVIAGESTLFYLNTTHSIESATLVFNDFYISLNSVKTGLYSAEFTLPNTYATGLYPMRIQVKLTTGETIEVPFSVQVSRKVDLPKVNSQNEEVEERLKRLEAILKKLEEKSELLEIYNQRLNEQNLQLQQSVLQGQDLYPSIFNTASRTSIKKKML